MAKLPPHKLFNYAKKKILSLFPLSVVQDFQRNLIWMI